MPMNVGFRWKGVNINAPKTMTERERLGENLGAIGETIFRVKQSRDLKDEREYNRNRNAELDRINAEEREYNRKRLASIDSMNAEDRRRRIAEEDRQRNLYGEAAGLIRGKADERARLVQQRNQIAAQIEAIKQRIGV